MSGDFFDELYERDAELKHRLRDAQPSDFQIVEVGEPYPYAVSWAGCSDIALFRRKADAERFIETFRRKTK